MAPIALLVERLYGPLKPQDGLAQRSIAAAEKRLRLRLPKVLRDYYLLAGKCGFNRVYYRLLRPVELRLRHEALVFYRDNHGMVEWGVKTAAAGELDPPVYQSAGQAQTPWRVQGSSLSEFLARMCCWQAVHGALPFGAITNIDGRIDQTIDALRAGLTPVLENPDMHIYAGPRRVAVIPPPGEHCLLYAAASTAEALQAVQRCAAVEWDDRWPH